MHSQAQRPIANGEFRARLPAALFQVQQQFEAALLALAVAVRQAHRFFVPLLICPDQHQQALLHFLQTSLTIDTVSHQEDELLAALVTVAPLLAVLFPACLPAADRAGRQARRVGS